MVSCPRHGEADQLQETVKLPEGAERQEATDHADRGRVLLPLWRSRDGREHRRPGTCSDPDPDDGWGGDGGASYHHGRPGCGRRIAQQAARAQEHKAGHLVDDKSCVERATSEVKQPYIECKGAYWDEDDGEMLDHDQVKAGNMRLAKHVQDSDVVELKLRTHVPEGVRVWNDSWCHRK